MHLDRRGSVSIVRDRLLWHSNHDRFTESSCSLAHTTRSRANSWTSLRPPFSFSLSLALSFLFAPSYPLPAEGQAAALLATSSLVCEISLLWPLNCSFPVQKRKQLNAFPAPESELRDPAPLIGTTSRYIDQLTRESTRLSRDSSTVSLILIRLQTHRVVTGRPCNMFNPPAAPQDQHLWSPIKVV